ncbi:hypothetical protein [Blastococcus litoris]|uniref:hypothetical protein n=1 Tax=Blastococcus litoris TaxID=2171622 RepID=UPI000E2FF74E|nr:hypothetical protein [Blastococcus litoris]
MRIRSVTGLVLSVLLLAACGSSEDEQRTEAFCEDAPALLEDITAELQEIGSDPAAAQELLGDAIDRMAEIEPPEDAADEWNRLRTAWGDLGDLFDEADLSDASANADLAPEAQRLQTELVESGDAVDEWSTTNC